ncbi:MAG: RecX family transcriptional regulator [Bacteroidales bacterium]|nr:RecX family transcriptional regulator [Bacteroidales bacterium]
METAQALQKLRDLCSRQEKCPADVLALLSKWGVDKEKYQEVLEKLKSEKFIDERRYATAFARDKMKFDHWGITKIRFQLQHKGISREVADEVLRETDMDEYRAMIEKEISKKRRTLRGSAREVWAKLMRYGMSRGYETETLRLVIGDGSDD